MSGVSGVSSVGVSVGFALTPLTLLDAVRGGPTSRWLDDWPDTGVGVSDRVSIDTGVGVSGCRDHSVGIVSRSGVEVSSQGSSEGNTCHVCGSTLNFHLFKIKRARSAGHLANMCGPRHVLQPGHHVAFVG